jgi:hypothetical protein
VRVVTKSCSDTILVPNRILVHISRSEHRLLDPDDVYSLRATGGETEVRLRSRTPLVDVRPIGEVAPLFEPFGFVRIHREHAANTAHVRMLQLRTDGRDWELKLEPPVNRVLPIARDRLTNSERPSDQPDLAMVVPGILDVSWCFATWILTTLTLGVNIFLETGLHGNPVQVLKAPENLHPSQSNHENPWLRTGQDPEAPPLTASSSPEFGDHENAAGELP